MCGRYAMAYSSDELPEQFAHYNIDARAPEKHYNKSYNVAPTNVSAVYKPNENTLKYMKWGLVPHWTKDVANFKAFRTFNAREESLQSSKMWSQCCNHKRCAIPISGYYEWKTNGRSKTPFYVTRKDGKLMFLAGMYDYVEKDDLYTYTIITGNAPGELKWLHERMPVVLEPGSDSWKSWFSDKNKWSQEELDKVLATIFNEETMKCYQVSNDVGKVSINEGYLTKPIFKQDKDVKQEDIQTKEEQDPEKVEEIPKKEEQSPMEEHAQVKRETPNPHKRDIVQMLSPRKKQRH
ncbi:hypothetical protein ZYGR_0BB00850 [Zygosaccharomyces rouxii]|uniref:Uncharacterized protein n=1 Tax=Zygosaccharomyces rouxii TaxID=4956 RepID=A0A1Q3AKP1_ZYGRO|nr:hypothetical protein ZYGR_0BB00850 [Zygosaccharomyces rouxii]